MTRYLFCQIIPIISGIVLCAVFYVILLDHRNTRNDRRTFDNHEEKIHRIRRQIPSGSGIPKGWLGWDNWSKCSKTCGPGSRLRNRYCISECNGRFEEVHTDSCPSNKECGLIVACDFTKECPDLNLDPDPTREDRYRWRRNIGDTPTLETGPSDQNHYIYADSSDGKSGDAAYLRSNITGGDGSYTLEFRYHMFGRHIANLTVNLINEKGIFIKEIFFSDSGLLNKWESAVVTFTPDNGNMFRVEFVARRHHGHLGDIALDDIKLSPEWGAWEDGECSEKCGLGQQTQTRRCRSQNSCVGSNTRTRTCKIRDCAELSPWSEWDACSVTCGHGERKQQRACFGKCEGVSLEKIQDCSYTECEKGLLLHCHFERQCYWMDPSNPKDYRWERRSGDTDTKETGPRMGRNGTIYMSVDADEGNEGDSALLKSIQLQPMKNKTCVNFWYHMYGVDINLLVVKLEDDRENKTIFEKKGNQKRNWIYKSVEIPTPRDFTIQFIAIRGSGDKGDIAIDDVKVKPCKSEYGPWGEWRCPCEGGKQIRNRICEDDGDCDGPSQEEKDCLCTPWRSSGACSAPCGRQGIQSRTRDCPCDNVENTICTGDPCPTICPKSWSTCSKTCGVGYRREVCSKKTQHCQIKPCEIVACNEWSEWSVCSVSCGIGVSSSRSSCTNGTDVQRTRSCMRSPGPGAWGKWSRCSHSCGPGEQARTQTDDCGNTVSQQTQACNNPPCCMDWSPWSACSVTCGTGEQTMTRTGTCRDGNSKTKACTIDKSTEWSNWSGCSTSCGKGNKTRSRINVCSEITEVEQCINEIRWQPWNRWICPCNRVQQRYRQNTENGCMTQSDTDSRPCNSSVCPVWNEWSPCSRPCGVGTSRRARKCPSDTSCNYHLKEQLGCFLKYCPVWLPWQNWVCPCPNERQLRTRMCLGEGCIGSNLESKLCASIKCPEWSPWEQCSSTCGLGGQMRRRTCPPNITCLYPRRVSKSCNQKQCGEWNAWGNWVCPCTNGKQSRTRRCTENPCDGDSTEHRDCSSLECPEWTTWTQCSESCGTGLQTRSRKCYEGTTCLYPLEDERFCRLFDCSHWGPWSMWTCPCVGNQQTRNRECVGTTHCSGARTDFRECSMNCPGWSLWSPCSSTCGSGIRTRTRICRTGIRCNYQLYDSRSCTMTACPVWGPWESWMCPCDGGEQSRSRLCIGTGCLGERDDSRPCAQDLCPGWSEWSTCRPSCGAGSRTRERICPDGTRCVYPLLDVNMCSHGPCPAWSYWGDWVCPCERGEQRRTRTCNLPLCPGKYMNRRPCASHLCPAWEEWISCSASCGNGVTIRRRLCPDGTTCVYPLQEVKICKTGDCPEWSSWEDWNCPCAGGRQFRQRTCSRGMCAGERVLYRTCTQRECPEWGSWSSCSATCGSGQRTRSRSCNQGTNCPYNLSESSVCSLPMCPVWSPWGRWVCPCENGVQMQNRTCQEGSCFGNWYKTRKCEERYCPGWLSWTPCSATCGNGKRRRLRTCPQNTFCPYHLLEDGSCNSVECSEWETWVRWICPCINGRYKRSRVCNGASCRGRSEEEATCSVTQCPEWQQWSRCTVSCGTGTCSRIRLCKPGTVCPYSLQQDKNCVRPMCPVWGAWRLWKCPCQENKQSRSRTCFGNGCVGRSSEERPCSSSDCPEWVTWTGCTASCGGGSRYRTRDCSDNMECSYDRFQSGLCAMNACPEWLTWGNWICPCVKNKMSRRRRCSGFTCLGGDTDYKGCSSTQCPEWTAWLPCTATCGSGLQSRTRACPDGTNCPYHLYEDGSCIVKECPSWGRWSRWSPCSLSCGGGISGRTRRCMNGNTCIGQARQTYMCNFHTCPVKKGRSRRCTEESCLLSRQEEGEPWGEWGLCKPDCTGVQRRERKCGIKGCMGTRSQTRKCQTPSCKKHIIFTQGSITWGEWSKCSRTCGIGEQTRECMESGNCTDNEKRPCITEVCTGVWRQWGSWSECSFDCTRSRHRSCLGDKCIGGASEIKQCDCPEIWQPWQKWTDCSVSCGRGVTSRKRVCRYNNCHGNPSETKDCDSQERCHDDPYSPWSKWSICTTTCGGNETQERSRDCIGQCPKLDNLDQRTCNECPGPTCNPCPETWSNWGIWTPCERYTNNACKKNRTRSCVSKKCEDSELDYGLCNEEKCSGVWSTWSQWFCVVTCDSGPKLRYRICDIRESCTGSMYQHGTCELKSCPGKWAPWHSPGCPANCGEGIETFTRICPGGNCTGRAMRTAPCLVQTPCTWNSWVPGNCSNPCGKGVQTKTRICRGKGCLGKSEMPDACDSKCQATLGDWTDWTCTPPCEKQEGGLGKRTRKCTGPCCNDECQVDDVEETKICRSPC